MKLFVLSIVLLLSLSSVNALFFKYSPGETRCFSEEVPKDTVILAKYKLEQPSTRNFGDKLGLQVAVTDPMGQLLKDLHIPERSSGRFAFTSHASGEYSICITVPKFNSPTDSLNLHFDIFTGVDAKDYGAVAKNEHLDGIQLQIRKLRDMVDEVLSEQEYQREREEIFRNTSESTNSRVLWWSVAQTIIILVTTLYSMRHFRNFFKAKKMI